MAGYCVLYLRMSRDRVGAGIGVARQEKDCRQLADTLGLTVRQVYSDNDMSAYSGKPRKDYRRMLADLQAAPAHVVTWHNDRLHRSPVELEHYIDVVDPLGILTYTVRAGALDLATPSGRLVARQLGAVARYESEHMAERIRARKDQAAADGQWLGGRRPFGFDGDGVTIRPAEAAVIAKATEDMLAGASLRWVTAGMIRSGIGPAGGGRTWRPRSVRLVLARPRNAGLMVHRGQVTGRASWGLWMDDAETSWGCIVSEAQFLALRALLADPSRKTTATVTRSHLGSGLYLCGVCGSPLRFYGNGRGGGYRCTDPEALTGRHVSRDAGLLDKYVSGLIVRWLEDHAAGLAVPRPGSGSDGGALAEAAELRGRMAEQAELHAEGELTGAQLAAGTRRLRALLYAAEQRVAASAAHDPLAQFAGAADVAAVWKGQDIPRRQAVVRAIMTVRVLPAEAGRPPGHKKGDTYFRDEFIVIDPVAQGVTDDPPEGR